MSHVKFAEVTPESYDDVMTSGQISRVEKGVFLHYYYYYYYYYQCWGKLLLKVMHYNIALLPKKVTNFVT